MNVMTKETFRTEHQKCIHEIHISTLPLETENWIRRAYENITAASGIITAQDAAYAKATIDVIARKARTSNEY